MQVYSLFSFLFLVGYTSLVFAQGNIIIDEKFDDWDTSLPTYTDGLDTPNGIDLIEMQASNDAEYLYVKFTIDEDVALGNMLVDHTIWLSIDADNNPSTGFAEQSGYGTELSINFNGHFGLYNVPNPDVQVTLGEMGLQMAPTVTSSTFEVAIPRDLRLDGVNDLFSTNTIRLVIHEDQGNDRMPNIGEIFFYTFDNTPVDPKTYMDLAKEDPSHLRAVAYNVLRDDAWEPAGLPSTERIIKALDGDIFCFQESYQTTIQAAKSYLDTWLPLNNGNGWYAYKDGGGRLTCSKWPITTTWDLNRKVALLIDLPASYPKDLLIINGHLSCCNNNISRQEQVDEFAAFVLDAKTAGGTISLPDSTPIIFLGDMNLVGFSQQLETIITGNIQDEATYGQRGPLDWDGSDLMDVRPLHLDSQLVFTWRDLQGDGFPPGRLDFLFYTDAVMDQMKAFILQTTRMPASLLAQYQLQSNDTEISDHLPLVVDYAFKSTVPTSQDEKIDVDIQLYPNPSGGVLFIETKKEIEHVLVRDMLGRKVMNAPTHNHRLDLAGLAAGIYVVEIKVKGRRAPFISNIQVE
ncbi:MAG: endonuclease/exonuclease/phosphatase family protein [Bacteroidota bacterium]